MVLNVPTSSHYELSHSKGQRNQGMKGETDVNIRRPLQDPLECQKTGQRDPERGTITMPLNFAVHNNLRVVRGHQIMN